MSRMRVLESFCRSKLGSDLTSCEDAFIVTEHFACVVDGATSPTGKRWTSEELTGGRWASKVLVQTIQDLSSSSSCLKPTSTAEEIVEALTQSLFEAYRAEGVVDEMRENPIERATASIVLYSRHLNQLIFVGDCQAVILDPHDPTIVTQRIQPSKFNDHVMANARSMYLQIELLKGAITRDDVRSFDVGRKFIEPLRQGQRYFQNNPKAPHPYQYWVLDGFPVSPNGIQTVTLHPNTDNNTNNHNHQVLVLASDGYPKVYPTLQETEQELARILESDPLLISYDNNGNTQSTKGVAKGAESFDDRTYLRIETCSPSAALTKAATTDKD